MARTETKIQKVFKNQQLLVLVAITLVGITGLFLGANIEKLTKIGSLIPKTAVAETISARDLKRALEKKDFTFINVHTPYEGEIEKTDTFIQYDELVANKDRLPKDKNAPIILYCKTGRMSAEALGTLKSLGYTNVRHLVGGMDAWQKAGNKVLDLAKLPDSVLPKDGFALPVSWGDLGPRLVELGVIDLAKLEEVVQLTDEQRKILTEGGDFPIKIDSTNSQFVVDLLWAAGLAQKSIVYEEGPMGKEYKKDAGNFASTGGWTLAKGDATNYLGKFDLVNLTEEQQKRVGEIAKNVYRPCCGNPTWFPDCNHGMAALAAIEFMVAKNLSDEEIYKNLLALNSFWFPETYLTIATYFARLGEGWGDIDAKEVLGVDFSSGQGAGEIYAKVGPLPYGGQAGGSCGT